MKKITKVESIPEITESLLYGAQMDFKKLYEWLMDENRKPAQTYFTEGDARNIAIEIEYRISKPQDDGQGGRGLRWVKASERLPEKKGNYCVRHLFKGGNYGFSTYQLGDGEPEHYDWEWLDDPALPVGDGEGEKPDWKEIPYDEACKNGNSVPATIHYYEDKSVWLKPISPSPTSAGIGEKGEDYNEVYVVDLIGHEYCLYTFSVLDEQWQFSNHLKKITIPPAKQPTGMSEIDKVRIKGLCNGSIQAWEQLGSGGVNAEGLIDNIIEIKHIIEKPDKTPPTE